MSFSFYIIKASGEKELFDIKKFKRSLKRCSAPTKLIMKIAHKIEKLPNLRTTKQIYAFALAELKKANPVLAALYNLKQALVKLGPSGFPFEHFVAKIFIAQGYKVRIDQEVSGYCVDHELDLIISKNKEYVMVECKFHNRRGLKSDVKIPLYIKARFDDIKKMRNLNPKYGYEFQNALIATNTKFTIQAREYAKCIGIQLLDWSYPRAANLPLLIQKYALYPITTLTTLSPKEQKLLIKKGIVLCRDISSNEWALKEMRLPAKQRQHVMSSAKELCKFTYT
jgi:hypothetical protein